MDFNEKWLEFDFNPWLQFDSNGKVLSLNQEAQYLLGEVSTQQIYNLALTYANRSYGFKTTMLDLEFGRYEFFGIMVGYEDEEAIAIRLYRKPTVRVSETHFDALSFQNIYTLIDLVISSHSINRKQGFTTCLDPTFPEIRLNPENFIALLGHMFECFDAETEIAITLSLKTGETLKFDNKRYPIFQVIVEGAPASTPCRKEQIRQLARQINGYIVHKERKIILEAPLIAS